MRLNEGQPGVDRVMGVPTADVDCLCPLTSAAPLKQMWKLSHPI